MTDRELLELAALAAGIKIDKSPYNGGGLRNTGFDVDGYAVLDWHNGKRWNPLTSDSDAFRLVAKLYLWEAVRLAHREVSDTVDIYAATRRAIVRAAAEIGRVQKETPDLSGRG